MSNIYYNNNRGKKRGFYGNVGKKIKGVGIFIFVAGMLTSIAIGVYYLTVLIGLLDGDLKALFAGGLPEEIFKPLIYCLVIPLGGTVASWLVSLLFYSYGEFVEKNT